MSMREFQFRKSYEEIKIAGKVYKVSLKDEDRKKYSDQLQKFFKIIQDIKSIDEDAIKMRKSLAFEEEMKTVVLETLDVTLGAGSGEELYQAAEEQTEELLDIVWGIADIINERRQEKVQKYSKKKR